METSQELGLRSEDLESLSSFFFLIFTPNPNRQTVKIKIDDGSISFSIKFDKFFKIIEELCGYELRKTVQTYCTVYGDTYCIDRINNTIEYWAPRSDNKIITAKELYEKNQKEKNLKKNFDQEYYNRSNDALFNKFNTNFSSF